MHTGLHRHTSLVEDPSVFIAQLKKLGILAREGGARKVNGLY